MTKIIRTVSLLAAAATIGAGVAMPAQGAPAKATPTSSSGAGSLCAAVTAAELNAAVPSVGAAQFTDVPESGGVHHVACKWEQSSGLGSIELSQLTIKNSAALAVVKNVLKKRAGKKDAQGTVIEVPAKGLGPNSGVTTYGGGSVTVFWFKGNSEFSLDIRPSDRTKALTLAQLLYKRR